MEIFEFFIFRYVFSLSTFLATSVDFLLASTLIVADIMNILRIL